jgi:Protein of unknown function, DUF481
MSTWLRALIIAVTTAPVAASTAEAQAFGRIRTDVVTVKSGDRVTGEIKNLDRLTMRVRSNDMGTVNVDWTAVVSVEAARPFEVEAIDGGRYQGNIGSPTPGSLRIDDPDGPVTLAIADVIAMSPIGMSWLGNLEGSFDMGSSYTRGSGIGQGTASFSMASRRPSTVNTVDFDGSLTTQEGQPDSSRYSLRYQHGRLYRDRWLIAALADAQRNTDLGLRLRVSGGGGPGYRLLIARRQRSTVLGGLVVDREVPVEGESTTNLFALGTSTYSLFFTSYPNTSLDVASELKIGLTDAGRVLFSLDVSARREIWRDFYISLTLYDSYDSRPPEGSTIKNDVGTSVSIGYQF